MTTVVCSRRSKAWNCLHVSLALAVCWTSAAPALHAQRATPKNDGDELETTVRLMTKIGTCSGPSFAPDGKRLAFVSDLNGVPQAWIVPAEGGWPTLLTTFNDPVTGVLWSPEGSWLALSVAPGGGMNRQIYLARPDGTGLHRITDGGKENNWLGPWSHDGRLLTMSSNRGGSVGMNVYSYEVASRKLSPVANNQGIGYLTDLGREGGLRCPLPHAEPERQQPLPDRPGVRQGSATDKPPRSGAIRRGPAISRRDHRLPLLRQRQRLLSIRQGHTPCRRYSQPNRNPCRARQCRVRGLQADGGRQDGGIALERCRP